MPSVKAAWYADVRRAGSMPRAVFWPVPNVDSGLVALTRRDPPAGADRAAAFAVIDAAFAQRRKTLRAALAGWAGSAAAAEERLRAAGVDPGLRGEALDVGAYARIAAVRSGPGRCVGIRRGGVMSQYMLLLYADDADEQARAQRWAELPDGTR